MSDVAGADQELAARLIERLLTDPHFRLRFRRAPAQACRDAGLEALASELEASGSDALMTLDVRESRSSLAGVVMAAAMEGVAIAGFVEHVVPALGGGDPAVADVLSRVDVPAVRQAVGATSGAAPDEPAQAPAPAKGAGPPAAVESTEPDAADAASAADAPDAAGLPTVADRAEPTPTPDTAQAASSSRQPERPVQAASVSEDDGGDASGASPVPDPAQYGLDGTGGKPTRETLALLDNPRVDFDEEGIADLRAGRIDPRVVALLTQLSEDHEITVTSMCSDHSRTTAGGSVSNHALGRGFDIGTIDGELVRPGSLAARELAAALAGLDESLRPDEIGTPFNIAEPGYFTDAAHQDHIHVGYKTPVDPEWAPPPDVAAEGGDTAAPEPEPSTPDDPVAAETSSTDRFLAVGEGPGAGGKRTDAFLALGGGLADAPRPDAGAAAPDALPDLGGNPAEYPGDDAPKEEIALWMARRAEAAGLPGELPVMAALVESNLANLRYGHSTSVGYFQMLTTYWDKGKYAGYLDDPEKQIQWFIDTALPLKGRFAGLPPTPENLGRWVADVERPAEQYRGRYALRLAEARELIERGRDLAEASGPAAPAAEEPSGPAPPAAGRRPDPSEYGLDGSGGRPTPETLALLENPNVHFDEVGIADLKAGRIDPRVVALLTRLGEDHEITVTCMCSDHSRLTAGGSVSNHALGRGVDIGTIDGELVRPGSSAALELAREMQAIDPSIRPDEVGTPFSLAGPGYFTDAGHQDHIHLGFKTAIDPGWRPPEQLAAARGDSGTGREAGAARATAPPAADFAAASGAARSVTDRFLAVGGAEDSGAAPPATAAFLAVPGEPAAPSAAASAEPPAAAEAGGGPADGPAEYPGDDAPRAEVAAWMARAAAKRGLPAELPLMAGLVESGMRNLRYGDADSVGFFQMRVSIWNTGEYAGYPERPELQLEWFLDKAEEVGRQRAARGLPVDDPAHYGEWVADVERPAEQYRGRYQLRLAEARNLLKQADAEGGSPAGQRREASGGGAAATDVPADAADAAGDASGSSAKVLAAVAEARKHLGVPYKWGGSDPATGFDCSGLVQYAYARAGIDLPRVAEDQMRFAGGREVDRDDLRAGDLVGFADSSGYVYHIGIHLGDGRFLHAPRTGDVVKVSSLDEPYFKAAFAGGLRVDPGGAPEPAAAEPRPADAEAPAASTKPPPVAIGPERSRTDEFVALRRQEATNHRLTALFLKAVDPGMVERAADATDGPLPGRASGPPAGGDGADAAPSGGGGADAAPETAAAREPLDSGPDGDYPGDGADRRSIAQWMARRAEAAGLPPELPVMAALVESNLKNLPYGHSTSVGYFQMLTTYWDKGKYAGYLDDPEKQIQWFVDHALIEKRRRLARGLSVDDPRHYGEWIADVERPAAQYRGRYQPRLDEARRLLR